MSETSTENQDRSDSPRWRGYLQIVVILAVIAIAIFFARAPSREFLEIDSSASQVRVAPTATVVQPQPESAAHEVALTGTVISLGTVTVKPEALGEIVWVAENYRTGGQFKADETLAQIDRSTYELLLAKAEALLYHAEGQLIKKTDKGDFKSMVWRKRYPDEPVHPWKSKIGPIQKARARVALAKHRIELAKLALDDTRIRMPFDGYVTITGLSVGQVVGIGDELGHVFPKYQLRVRAQIPTSDLNSIEPAIGRKATVIADGKTYLTEVERVTRTVDIDTRLAALHLKVLNQADLDTLPRPGTFVDVMVQGPIHENVFVLPESAMQINGSVWRVRGGQLTSIVPESLGFNDRGWLVKAFDPEEGVVTGQVAGATEGLNVNAVAAD